MSRSFYRAALVLGALASCATASHYNRSTGLVTSREGIKYFTGTLDAGWQEVATRGGNIALFHSQQLALISSDVNCDIHGDPPLHVLYNHLTFGFTDREIVSEETLQLNGRDALHVIFTAKLDGVARKFETYTIKKNDCVFDLIYHAPEKTFSVGANTFASFVKSFRTVP